MIDTVWVRFATDSQSVLCGFQQSLTNHGIRGLFAHVGIQAAIVVSIRLNRLAQQEVARVRHKGSSDDNIPLGSILDVFVRGWLAICGAQLRRGVGPHEL